MCRRCAGRADRMRANDANLGATGSAANMGGFSGWSTQTAIVGLSDAPTLQSLGFRHR